MPIDVRTDMRIDMHTAIRWLDVASGILAETCRSTAGPKASNLPAGLAVYAAGHAVGDADVDNEHAVGDADAASRLHEGA